MFLDQRDHELFEKEWHAFGCLYGTFKQRIRQLERAWHRCGDLKRLDPKAA